MSSTFKRKSHSESNFELQITALIDTLVIILIFLLKSLAVDTLDMDSSKGLNIVSVNDGVSTGKGNHLEISQVAVSWNGAPIVEYQNFDLKNAKNGADGWKSLNNLMAETVQKEKDSGSFDGKIFLQADKNTPLASLREVLQVAKAHGYKDIKFVGAKLN